MRFTSLLLLATAVTIQTGCGKTPAKTPDRVVLAYVTSWSDVIPDPAFVTHINYAFGHVNDSFDGVRIDGEERLKTIVGLKKKKASLKVMLSIGGWGSGRFSEMAADDVRRAAFAADCKRVVDGFGLDGIDIDWEFPTSGAAGISSSPDDKDNFTLLVKAIRAAIGPGKLLTLASNASPQYYNFMEIVPYVDFVNIMTYDMGNPPKHHSALYRSSHTGWMCCDEAIDAHIEAGISVEKLTLGLPFYGHGKSGLDNFVDYNEIVALDGYTENWDDEAMVPYLTNAQGEFVCTYDNARSIAIKCGYANRRGMLGAMYWDYSLDDADGTLRKATWDGIMNGKAPYGVLVLTERGGQHGPFTDAGLEWLGRRQDELGFVLTEINDTKLVDAEFLSRFRLIIQLDYPPYGWTPEAEKAFTAWVDEGLGGWIGFHHATLLGEFDSHGMWQWFSDFMGGIRFQNYIAALADGTVNVEAADHPVMKGVPASFVIPDDEWYTFDASPRPNVQVLASVDEASYDPASDIRMGDHPVVWTNPAKKAPNVYFLPGHTAELYGNAAFTTMFANAIRWCAGE